MKYKPKLCNLYQSETNTHEVKSINIQIYMIINLYYHLKYNTSTFSKFKVTEGH